MPVEVGEPPIEAVVTRKSLLHFAWLHPSRCLLASPRSAGDGFESSRSGAEGRCESCVPCKRESICLRLSPFHSGSALLLPSGWLLAFELLRLTPVPVGRFLPPKARGGRGSGGRLGAFGAIRGQESPHFGRMNLRISPAAGPFPTRCLSVPLTAPFLLNGRFCPF